MLIIRVTTGGYDCVHRNTSCSCSSVCFSASVACHTKPQLPSCPTQWECKCPRFLKAPRGLLSGDTAAPSQIFQRGGDARKHESRSRDKQLTHLSQELTKSLPSSLNAPTLTRSCVVKCLNFRSYILRFIQPEH